MTPHNLALPAVQLAGALIISSRIHWRKHPALIAYLVTEALGTILVSLYHPIKPWWTCLVQIPVRTFVVLEVLAFARMGLSRQAGALAVGSSLAACAFAVSISPRMQPLEQLYLFRSYYLLILCSALLAVTIRRFSAPMLECRRHTIYRVGAAAWLCVVGVAGTFCRGGLGYAFFAYDRSTWAMVDAWTYGALVAVVGMMTLAMWLTLPRPRAVARTGDAWLRRNDVIELRRAS